MDLTEKQFAGTLIKALLLGGVILVGLLYAQHGARRAWQTRTALQASIADEESRTTARVVRGVVAESALTQPRPAPTHVAWMARLGQWRGSGKSSTYVVTCTVARVDGLRVEDATTHETFIVDGYQAKARDFADGMSIDRDRVTVDLLRGGPPAVFPVSSATLPEAVRGLCADAVPSDSFNYRESWVERGNAITIRGCTSGTKRGNDTVIVPCGDGLDAISTSGLAALRRAARDGQAGSVGYGALGAFVGLGLLGLIASTRLVRSKRPAGATP